MQHPKWRGPFRVAAVQDGREMGGGVFDTTFEALSRAAVSQRRSALGRGCGGCASVKPPLTVSASIFATWLHI
jgi:hypothetical protein